MICVCPGFPSVWRSSVKVEQNTSRAVRSAPKLSRLALGFKRLGPIDDPASAFQLGGMIRGNCGY